MITTLFMMSFLIHIVLLALIYRLYQQLQQVKATKDEDTEKLLSEFLNEIKRENLYLQHQIQQSKNKQQSDKTVELTPIKEKTANESIYTSLYTEKEDKVETSVDSKIFQLHQQGMSIDEIAKKVNKGKTEVELMIKLKSKG